MCQKSPNLYTTFLGQSVKHVWGSMCVCEREREEKRDRESVHFVHAYRNWVDLAICNHMNSRSSLSLSVFPFLFLTFTHTHAHTRTHTHTHKHTHTYIHTHTHTQTHTHRSNSTAYGVVDVVTLALSRIWPRYSRTITHTRQVCITHTPAAHTPAAHTLCWRKQDSFNIIHISNLIFYIQYMQTYLHTWTARSELTQVQSSHLINTMHASIDRYKHNICMHP